MPNLRKIIKTVALEASSLYYGSQKEEKVALQSHLWWNDAHNVKRPAFSHWKSAFEEETWDQIGLESWNLFNQFSKSLEVADRPQIVMEWGCGGGANAIHFAKYSSMFYGVDISDASLDECERQLADRGIGGFQKIAIDSQNPECVHGMDIQPLDLFFSVYVFELIPSESYGERILKIAHRLLKSSGVAMIQIKYSTHRFNRSHRSKYSHGVSSRTSYPIHEFWKLSERCGLTPHAVHLVPEQPLVGDERYAYFFLKK